MSTPPKLSPEDQSVLTAIQDACAQLHRAITAASNQTGLAHFIFAKIIQDNFSAAASARRLTELTEKVEALSLRRAIAAKLTREERAIVGLKGDGVDNVP
jgi:hypothetical protein